MEKRGERMRILAFSFLAVILGIASAWAQAGAVAVDVKIILASNDGTGVDPKLGDLRGRLGNLKFDSYKLLSVKSIQVAPPGGGSVSLPGGKTLQISDVERAKNRVQMNVAVADVVRTRVSLKKNGTVMLGGIDQDGGELILAISAKF